MKTKTANGSKTHHNGVEPQASDHFRGSLDAPLTLIEYGDYQCPYCGIAHATVLELIEELGDRLCYVYRNFPLTEVHENAEAAAEAAEAAGQRGKFWEMHDALFENQEALDSESLAEYARDLGLDAEQILEEIEAEKYSPKIKTDFQSGVKLGVSGTPTFFINGKLCQGEDDAESLKMALLAGAEQVP